MSQEGIPQSILVADDDLGFLIWANSVLADAGYTSWPASTITEALKWMDEPGRDFQLLLIDPGFPGASDLVRTVRKKYPRLKVALLSEGGDAADAVLPKPVDPENRRIVSVWLMKIALLMSEDLPA